MKTVKKCTQCEWTKPLIEFYKSGDKYTSYCKECHLKYTKLYHQNQRERKRIIPYNKINDILLKRGIRKNWLAAEIGKTKSTMSAYCQNKMQPSVKVYFDIARALEINVGDLFNNDVLTHWDEHRNK